VKLSRASRLDPHSRVHWLNERTKPNRFQLDIGGIQSGSVYRSPQLAVPQPATERLDLLGDFQMIDFECIHWRKIGSSLKDEAAELAVQAKATGRSFQPALNHLCDLGS
jgi:hypothetical protein